MTTNDELLRRADELLDETVLYVSAALDKMQQRAERAERERDEAIVLLREARAAMPCCDTQESVCDRIDAALAKGKE